MANIVSIHLKDQYIDVSRVFAQYKYAIPEHQPIQLSNGCWLHSYKVTKYREQEPAGDPDVEQEAFDREMY